MSSISKNVNVEYNPTNNGIITFYIPRLHNSVTEEDVQDILIQNFANEVYKYDTELADDVYEYLSFKESFQRIDFKPIQNNQFFKTAFIYMTPYMKMTPEEYNKKINDEKNVIDSKNNGIQIAKDVNTFLLQRETSKTPLKIEFFINENNNKKCFWMLLPNRNPLTTEQKEITDDIGVVTNSIMELLFEFAMNDVCIPSTIDTDYVINPTNEDYRLQTTNGNPVEITKELLERFDKLSSIHSKLIELMIKNNKQFIPENVSWADYE